MNIKELERRINNHIGNTVEHMPKLFNLIRELDTAITTSIRRDGLKGTPPIELIANRNLVYKLLKENCSVPLNSMIKEINNTKKVDNESETIQGEKIKINFGNIFDE